MNYFTKLMDRKDIRAILYKKNKVDFKYLLINV